MIVVTGATGQLGSRIVEHLLTRVPATEIGVTVRDPEKARKFEERGVRVRAADFTRPETLRHAFEGADRVLVVSASIRGEAAAAANIAAIDAAEEAGAGRILYTSHQAASTTSLFAPMLTHAVTEEHLQNLGIPFTALRNGFYATTLGYYLDEKELRVPEDGPVSWTAHADLAEAAAIALTDDSLLNGITPPLTATEALDFDAVARILSVRTGRTVTRVVVDDEDWKADAIGNGMPAAAAEFALGMFRAARRGEFAVTDPTLEAVVGHPTSAASQLVAGFSG